MKYKILLLAGLILLNIQSFGQLLKAIEKGDNKKIESLISEKQELINAEKSEKYGDYAIHLSALNHDKDLLQKLIAANTNVNLQNGRGNTALHISVAEKDENLTEILTNQNPDFNIKNFNGNDILLLACKNNMQSVIKKAFPKDENINDQNQSGFSALMYAVSNNDKATAEVLLNSGANVSQINKAGKSALDMVKTEEMRWLIGTEDHLSAYVKDVATLSKYQKKFPESKNLQGLARIVLGKSSKYAEAENLDGLRILPDSEIEERSVELVQDYAEAKKFKTRFPSSKYNKQVVLNALQESSSSEIIWLKELYAADFQLDSLDFTYINSNDYRRSKFLNAQFVLNPMLTLDDIDKMFTEYSWLKFDDKSNIIMENYWNICTGALSFGTVVIEIMRSLPLKPEYEITETVIENFIQQKLESEVKKHVRLLSVKNIGTENPEWDLWCKNDVYTAGLVKDEGDIRYIVYGEIQNNSIFDLPVRIDATADLFKHEEMSASGFFGMLIMLVAVLTGSETSSDKKIASVSNTYYIPAAVANDNGLYAVMLDFGEGIRREGVNFFDELKVTSEIRLENPNANLSYSNHKLTTNEIERQDKWQDLAENGMPTAKLYDMLRGSEVQDAQWRQKWDVILEERRQAAEEYNRMQNEIDRKVQVLSGKKDDDFTIDQTTEDANTLHVSIIDGGTFS